MRDDGGRHVIYGYLWLFDDLAQVTSQLIRLRASACLEDGEVTGAIRGDLFANDVFQARDGALVSALALELIDFSVVQA